jgi:hypothetical protein
LPPATWQWFTQPFTTLLTLISKKYSPYRVSIDAPAGASEEAATAAAAHRTLVSLYPAQAGKFDAALQSSLAKIPDGKAKQDGIALGQQVADQIISSRNTDGITKVVEYTPSTDPGIWVPTPPALAAALAPQWPQVTPFAMTSGSQFRPPSTAPSTQRKLTMSKKSAKVTASLGLRTKQPSPNSGATAQVRLPLRATGTKSPKKQRLSSANP